MKIIRLLSFTLLTGVVMAGVLNATAFAWHPEGQIKKYVQNQTTGSALQDANTAQGAVSAQPGDVLKYVIEVSNTGQKANNGWNDMHYTKLTDMLPAGVELVSDPGQRQIVANLGVIKPGEKVTKEYAVRVTSTTNQEVITNKACFTGDSEVYDNKQEGCDPAVVTVTVPDETPEQPEEPEMPAPEQEEPVADEPEVLPATGAGSVVGVFAGFTGLGYATHRIFSRRR